MKTANDNLHHAFTDIDGGAPRQDEEIDYNEGYLQQPIKDIVKKAKEATAAATAAATEPTEAPYETSEASLWHVILYDNRQVSHKYDVAASSAAEAREAALIQHTQRRGKPAESIDLIHVYPLTGCKVYKKIWQEI